MGKSRRSCRKDSTNTRVIRYGASGKLFVCAMTGGLIFGLQSLGTAFTPCKLFVTPNRKHFCKTISINYVA